jgi:hypothetical protein
MGLFFPANTRFSRSKNRPPDTTGFFACIELNCTRKIGFARCRQQQQQHDDTGQLFKVVKSSPEQPMDATPRELYSL